MTIYQTMLSPARQTVLTALFLLLCLQMVLFLALIRIPEKRRMCWGCLIHFLLSFALFYPAMLTICWVIYNPNLLYDPPSVLLYYRSWPVSVLILYEILTAGIILAAFISLLRYRKNHPDFESVKETMDLLPVGIAFGKTDGTVVFSNLAINKLSRRLTGKRITDISAFRNALQEKDPDNEDRKIMQAAVPDGSAVWQLTSETAEVDGEQYIQLIASDITRQAAMSKELEEKNKKLRDLHMRLSIYNKQADRIIIAQELLNARIAVHNEVGNVLLESRHYLKEPSSFNEEMLLKALKNTNTYLLREYEKDDTERDPLTDAMEMADAIGVDVEITGHIPQDDPYRSVLAASINECATNTVKHAGGDSLSADIQHTETDVVFVLQSNGTPPAGPVRESGGLASLRAYVEKEHGSMRISVDPSFMIMISLPKNE